MASNVRQMEELVNELLQNGKNRVPYSLFIGETEVTTSLKSTVEELVRGCNYCVVKLLLLLPVRKLLNFLYCFDVRKCLRRRR